MRVLVKRRLRWFLAVEGALLCAWGGAALLEACATGELVTGPDASEQDSSSGNDSGKADAGDAGIAPDGACLLTKCGSACVDTKTDNANCGQCNHACTNATCDGGVCVPTCATQQKVCAGDAGLFCASIETDNANCGDCNVACQQPFTCQTGKCLPTCQTSETLCDVDGSADGGPPFCANVQTDPYNCGTCDHACNGGQSCDAGACVSPPPTCASVNGLLWCYYGGACGEACNAVCAHFGKTPVSNSTAWLNAQNTNTLCQNIATAFGVGSASASGYTYACAEDSWGLHGFNGGLIGPLLCSTTTNCPTDHLATMDQGGINCDASTQTRRSICPCQ